MSNPSDPETPIESPHISDPLLDEDGDGKDQPAGAPNVRVQDLRLKFEKIAKGEIPYEPTKGRHSYKISNQANDMLIYLQLLTGHNRKEIITLAVMEYIRFLTSRAITSQNDLALLTQGLQYALHDLALETQAFSELAVQVADQESLTVDKDQRL